MRVLAILAVPAIVLTSLVYAGDRPRPAPPRVSALSMPERARIVAAQALPPQPRAPAASQR